MTRTLSRTFAALLLAAAIAAPAQGGEIAGLAFPDTMQAGGQEVALAGLGLRTKFVVKVYAAGLYLPAGSGETATAVFADVPKAFVMRFLYKEVEGAKLQDAWREGFADNTKDPSADLKARMDRFVALFSTPALKGEEFSFEYQPGTGTRVVLRGQEADLIPGDDFMKALMGIWFGPDPADGGLKKDVLAGRKK